MNIHARKSVLSLTLLLILLTATSHAQSLVPDGLIIEDTFKPGIGEPVGKIRQTRGNTLIIHSNSEVGYKARQNLSLFKGDTVITRKAGRITCEMNDGSRLSIAGQTKIVINKSVYDPDTKNRSSFLGMSLGKARFWVRKLPGFRRSEFKVKTKTAVVGVRGSDFIIEAAEDFTKVKTFADTLLEVVSLSARCEKYDETVECEVEQYLLNEFEQVVIEKHDRVLESETLSPGDNAQAEDEFPLVLPGSDREYDYTEKTEPVEQGKTSLSEKGEIEKDGVAPHLGRTVGDQKEKTGFVPRLDDDFTRIIISVEDNEITEPDMEITSREVSSRKDLLKTEYDISENINKPAKIPVTPPDYPGEPE